MWKKVRYFGQYVNAVFGRLPRGVALAIGGPGSKRSVPALRLVRWAANDLRRAGLVEAANTHFRIAGQGNLAMSALRIDNDPGCREDKPWVVVVRALAV